MPPRIIDAPGLLTSDRDQIALKIDQCWAEHKLSEFIIQFLTTTAQLNGYLAPAELDILEVEITAIVVHDFVPRMKTLLASDDVNLVFNTPSAPKWRYKGLPSVSEADKTHAPIRAVVECVYVDGPGRLQGLDGQKLGVFVRRRTRVLQGALVTLIRTMIDFSVAT